MDDLDEIVAEFLVESHENLDQLDRDLVALEQAPDSRELLASIFRTIHTLKGTSGFLAFSRLEELTHVGENLLAKLRDGVMRMTPGTTDALLCMVDSVRELLAAIESDGSESGSDVSVAVAAVRAVLDADPAAVPAAPVAPPTEPVLSAEPTQIEPTQVEQTQVEPIQIEPIQIEPAQIEPPSVAPPTPTAAASAPPTAVPTPPSGEDGGARRAVADSSIRVDVELLDSLMRLVGELVITRNQILRRASESSDTDLARATQRLNIIATELQEEVMKTRMQPMEHLWSKLPRVVRDLGAQCGKSVSLEMIGKETELDRTLLEAVKDPLTHLVRNSVDHGIEPPAVREAAGKPGQGTLTLRAFHEGGQVVVEVSDDGAGIDPEKIRDSAVRKGIVSAEQTATMSPTDLLQLIFRPGFSTAAAVTNVSGRGVGMDVVKTNIENIGGAIEVESHAGLGTTCRLRIPLTLAIIPALTVDCADDTFAIPQVNLLELVALDSAAHGGREAIEHVGDAEVYRLRGQLLPLVRLDALLHRDVDGVDRGAGVIAVLQSEGRRFGLVVDRVVNTEDIVVKPLSRSLKSIGVFSGATILGDGRVSLILDVQCIARTALRAETMERLHHAGKGADVPDTDQEKMLVVGLGEDRRVAIPLTSVTRLEEVQVDEIEHVGHREVIRRKDGILPLIRLEQLLGGLCGDPRETLPIVVYASEGRSVAMGVDSILDIIDASAAKRSDIDDSGLLGSLIVKERVTELLDVRSAILAADPRFYESHEFDHFGLEVPA